MESLDKLNEYTIYKVTNTINNKSYIGCTRFTLEERKKKHLTDYNLAAFKHRKFYAALNEYGEDSFTWEVIETASDKPEAIEREKYWIRFCNSCRHGYNANTGGSGTNGYTYSPEQLKVMSDKKLGLYAGSKSVLSKLNEHNVYIIKKLLSTGVMKQTEIANLYNVDSTTINAIKAGRTWRHVTIETAKSF